MDSGHDVLVLPTYTEADNIEPFIEAVCAAAPSLHVLIVDDCSPDGTGGIAERLAARHPNVRVMHRDGERGLGKAYRAGFAAVADAGYAAVLCMDADFSHDPSVIPSLLGAVHAGADVVVGSRYCEGGAIVDWPKRRTFLSKWGNLYTRAILGINARDCTSGYRAYSARAMQVIEPTTVSGDGYVFLSMLLNRATRNGLVIRELPITFRNRVRGTSKMNTSIIVESMARVTVLGLRQRLLIRRRAGGT
jgi:dolichol-phosphate mannosyltransferase